MNKIALLVPLLALLLSCGLLEQSTGGDTPMMSAEPPYRKHLGGLFSLEEMMAGRNTIVRATMTATSSEIILHEDVIYNTPNSKYWVIRKFQFTALEYLKGRGPDSFTAVWVYGRFYDTRAGAEEARARVLAAVDANWENTTNDAILFLHSAHGPKQEGQILYELLSRNDHFLLGLGDHYDDDRYSLRSDIMRAWLPRPLSEPCPVGQTCPEATKYQTALPPASEFIATAKLKQMIADITAELARNTSDEYRECVLFKYGELRRMNHWQENRGYQYTSWPQDDPTVAPGAPAGTEIAHRPFRYGNYPDPAPSWMQEGASADLFSITSMASTDPRVDSTENLVTARPLVPGEYTFVIEDDWNETRQLCGHTATTNFTVTVEPEGSVHSFFFDPVTVGGAVAADASNGVLKPASFTGADGSTTTISRMAWEPSATSTGSAPGSVEVEIVSTDLDEALGDHVLDFIELDGSVSLSLDVFDATVESQPASGTGTRTHNLTWALSSQPWESGDQLMVRIREAAQSSCRNGTVVPNPRTKRDLVDDCEVLLSIRDSLDVNGTLNWSPDIAISTWEGVTIEDTPARVTRLQLYGKELGGVIPVALGELSEIEWLFLISGHLTGSIPSELSKLQEQMWLNLDANLLTGGIPSEFGRDSRTVVGEARDSQVFIEGVNFLTVMVMLTGNLGPDLVQLPHNLIFQCRVLL